MGLKEEKLMKGDFQMKFGKKTCNVPMWANWVAQDADGEWCAFKYRPHLCNSIWLDELCRNVNWTKRLCKVSAPRNVYIELWEVY